MKNSRLGCPKCIGILEKKSYPCHDGSELSIDTCWTCNGIWLDRGEMHKIWDAGIEKVAEDWVKPGDLNHEKKDAKCPRCNVLMKSIRNIRDARLLQDVCPECFGIWLDAGELAVLGRGGPIARMLRWLRGRFESRRNHQRVP